MLPLPVATAFKPAGGEFRAAISLATATSCYLFYRDEKTRPKERVAGKRRIPAFLRRSPACEGLGDYDDTCFFLWELWGWGMALPNQKRLELELEDDHFSSRGGRVLCGGN